MSTQRTYRKRIRHVLKKVPIAPTRGQTVGEILTEQIEVAMDATRLANKVLSSEREAQHSRRSMRNIEHEGDDARQTLGEKIDVALTVPLEREDLFRASRSIDDVTDHLRDMVREIAKWEVPTGSWSKNALEPALLSLRHLRSAVVTDDWTKAREECLAARRQAGKLRRVYQNGVTKVFSEKLSIDTLKKREILRRIDSVGGRLTEASDALLDGMIKRYL